MTEQLKTRVFKINVKLDTNIRLSDFNEWYKKNKNAYVKIKNLVYQQLLMDEVFIPRFKELDQAFLLEEQMYQERISSKEAQLSKLVEQKKDGSKTAKALVASIDRAKNDLIRLRKSKSKESRETLNAAIGLNSDSRFRKLFREMDCHSNVKDVAAREAKLKFQNDRAELLAYKRTPATFSFEKGHVPVLGNNKNLKVFQHKNGKWGISILTGNGLVDTNGTVVSRISFTVENGRTYGERTNINKTLQFIMDNPMELRTSRLKWVRAGKSNKLQFHLSLTEPIQSINSLDPNKIIGVDMGLNIGAYCVFLNNPNYKKQIGNEGALKQFKNQIRAEKRLENRKARYGTSGHGRKRKVEDSKREHLRTKEQNYTKTYNHQISREIINFAIRMNAGVIRLEDLSKKGLDNETVSNWTYYQLTQQIIYKAEEQGIVVEKVNPRNTSRTCSNCNYLYNPNDFDGLEWIDRKDYHDYTIWNSFDFQQRESTKELMKHTFWTCPKCNEEHHRDFNAALNIARGGIG